MRYLHVQLMCYFVVDGMSCKKVVINQTTDDIPHLGTYQRGGPGTYKYIGTRKNTGEHVYMKLRKNTAETAAYIIKYIGKDDFRRQGWEGTVIVIVISLIVAKLPDLLQIVRNREVRN